MKTHFLLFFFLICYSALQAQLFGPDQVVSASSIYKSNILNADLDGDGDQDVLFSENEINLAWYENDKGKFLPFKQIEGFEDKPIDISVQDIDSDGDLDLAFIVDEMWQLAAWRENDGNGSFGPINRITKLKTDVHSIKFTDVNGDGNIDLVAHYSNEIAWLQNDGSGNFGTVNQIVATPSGYSREIEFDVGDIDGDGKMDITVAYGFFKGGLSWYQNQGTMGFSAGKSILVDSVAYGVSVHDMDGDGNVDLFTDVVRPTGVYSVLYNNRGLGVFTPQVVQHLEGNSRSASFYDFDGDDDIDIVHGKFWQMVAIENKGGRYDVIDRFRTGYQPINCLADFDGDKKIDIFHMSDYRTSWYKGLGNTGFSSEKMIAVYDGVPKDFCLSEINNDKDKDLVIVNDSLIVWKEFLGNGKFGPSQIIDSTVKARSTSRRVLSADINTDGRMDILVEYKSNGDVVWYENLGNGKFGPYRLVTNEFDLRRADGYLYLKDMDGDGDPDFLWSYKGGGILFYENLGAGIFDSKKLLSNGPYFDLEVQDLDNDGDLDMITTHPLSAGFEWHENDGKGTFEKKVISHLGLSDFSGLTAIIPMDIDGDGDQDILEFKSKVGGLVRYTQGLFIHENMGDEEFVDPQFQTLDIYVASHATARVDVLVDDLDGDGDLDLIYTHKVSGVSSDFRAWLPNVGNNSFGARRALTSNVLNGTGSIGLMDLDNDGDNDIIRAFDGPSQIVWNENLFGSAYRFKGNVYYDENQNGSLDIGEKGMTLVKTQVQPSPQAGYSNASGEYSFSVVPGIHTVSYATEKDWKLTSDSNTYTRTLDKKTPVAKNLDFGFYQKKTETRLRAGLVSGLPRCNRLVSFWVNIRNIGTSIPSGIVHLRLDDSLVLDSVPVQPDSVVGQNVYWHFDDLFFSEHQNFRVIAKMPAVRDSSNTLNSRLIIHELDNTGKVVYTDSIENEQEVVCAYDPNDKQVSPQGVGQLGLIKQEQELTYLVRFQNTGNDTAFTVMIRDQLDANLDWSTLKPLSSSHAMEAKVEQDGEVVFTFKNILLPDSNVNELESHGFVEYSIWPKEDLKPLAQISSPAAIYFDFNPAVVTNNVLNTILCYTAPNPEIRLIDQQLESGLIGDYQFQWYLDGQIIEGATASSFAPEKVRGAYMVEVTDENTCSGVSEPFDYTPEGVEGLDNIKTSIYPNPFGRATTIQFDQDLAGRYDLIIYNVIGVKVLSFTSIRGNQVVVNQSELGKGVFLPYLMNTETGEKVLLEKIIAH